MATDTLSKEDKLLLKDDRKAIKAAVEALKNALGITGTFDWTFNDEDGTFAFNKGTSNKDQKKFLDALKALSPEEAKQLAEAINKYLNDYKTIKEKANANTQFTDDNGNKLSEGTTTSADEVAPKSSKDDATTQTLTKVDEINNTPKAPTTLSTTTSDPRVELLNHMSWDPRLTRMDSFLRDEDGFSIIVPLASYTIASTFADLTYKLEKGMALDMVNASKSGLVNYGVSLILKKLPTSDVNSQTAEGSANTQKTNNNVANDAVSLMGSSDKIIMSATSEFKYDGYNYGARSVMNPYSLTKLMGGISAVIPELSALNYMYDIRDRRRFYDLSVEQTLNDPLTVHNPTVTNIIRWSNSDKWGRTPYSYLDFVFNKWFGILPTNRLITFRRYSVPTYDNLNFESMWGKIESEVTTTKKKTTTKTDNKQTDNSDGNGKSTTEQSVDYRLNPKSLDPEGTFSPHATVVSYFGGDSGNQLSLFLNFTTGTKWREIESKIHEVSGDEGTDPLMEIDSMFEGGGFGTAANSTVSSFLKNASTVSSKIMSFGKFAMAANGPVGQSEAVMMKTFNALEDPYGSGGVYENRVIGPINRIGTVKARDAGIEFEQSFTLKVSYVGKAIGGINPKAALLDCLGNAMEMCSPTAVFWGGGHRFMITPHTYPFHNGGWRGNFMEAIYNGKFLGNNGAISIIGSGIKKFATNDKGEFDLGNLTGNIGGGIGSIVGAISAGLSALGSSIGIGGLGDVLSSAASWLSGKGEGIGGAESVNKGKEAFGQLSSNLSRMWHDKCLQLTTFPLIKGMGSLLSGEPVGEWHLTVGNPLNPIIVCGNLICPKMTVEWDDELGPDDFPNGFTVTYTIEHGMPRDKDAIQSMFNRGMGKFYSLPDYMKLSSDMETAVDSRTGGSSGHTGELAYMNPGTIKSISAKDGLKTSGYNKLVIQGGNELATHANPNINLITKFTPVSTASLTFNDIRSSAFLSQPGAMARIRANAATIKMTAG